MMRLVVNSSPLRMQTVSYIVSFILILEDYDISLKLYQNDIWLFARFQYCFILTGQGWSIKIKGWLEIIRKVA